jgi:hypothetical protein
MYCWRCAAELPNGTAPPPKQAGQRPCFCRRCGALVVGEGSEDPIARKTAELERFGLAARGDPLLRSEHGA